MKIFCATILLLAGCASSQVTQSPVAPLERAVVQSRLSSAQPLVVSAPVLHVGFTDSNGAVWPSNDWTNYYTLVALTTSDPALPISEWSSNAPVLEIHNGELSFPLPMDGLNGFCRALYIYKEGVQ